MINKGSRPLLSVIIPVYNTDQFLEVALNSILNQNFTQFEVIAVNDGSTDKSGKILNDYADKDSRVHVFHRSHSGVSASRNFGLENANGNYIYFFDSDDILLPGAFAILIPLIKNTGSEVIGFSGRYIYESDESPDYEESLKKPEVHKPIQGELLLEKMIKSGDYSPIVSMFIYRKSFLKNQWIHFAENYIHEDEFYTISVLCNAERVISTSKIFFEHRIRKGSIMSNKLGIKNLEGWGHAVSQMLDLIKKKQLSNSTNQAVLARAQQLASNCIRIIHKLNREKNTKLSINDYWTDNEIEKLGMEIRFKYRFPNLFRVYNRLKYYASRKYLNYQ